MGGVKLVVNITVSYASKNIDYLIVARAPLALNIGVRLVEDQLN